MRWFWLKGQSLVLLLPQQKPTLLHTQTWPNGKWRRPCFFHANFQCHAINLVTRNKHIDWLNQFCLFCHESVSTFCCIAIACSNHNDGDITQEKEASRAHAQVHTTTPPPSIPPPLPPSHLRLLSPARHLLLSLLHSLSCQCNFNALSLISSIQFYFVTILFKSVFLSSTIPSLSQTQYNDLVRSRLNSHSQEDSGSAVSFHVPVSKLS